VLHPCLALMYVVRFAFERRSHSVILDFTVIFIFHSSADTRKPSHTLEYHNIVEPLRCDSHCSPPPVVRNLLPHPFCARLACIHNKFPYELEPISLLLRLRTCDLNLPVFYFGCPVQIRAQMRTMHAPSVTIVIIRRTKFIVFLP